MVIYTDTLYSPVKIQKQILKKFKKFKKPLNNFWGPCQVLNNNIHVSRQSILKQGFQKTHFPMVLTLETSFAVDLANFYTLCKISDP